MGGAKHNAKNVVGAAFVHTTNRGLSAVYALHIRSALSMARHTKVPNAKMRCVGQRRSAVLKSTNETGWRRRSSSNSAVANLPVRRRNGRVWLKNKILAQRHQGTSPNGRPMLSLLILKLLMSPPAA
jgi:hypothetical protein